MPMASLISHWPSLTPGWWLWLLPSLSLRVFAISWMQCSAQLLYLFTYTTPLSLHNCVFVIVPDDVRVPGVQTLQWQVLSSSPQRKVVQSGGKTEHLKIFKLFKTLKVSVIVFMTRQFRVIFLWHPHVLLLLFSDHQHVWQQSDGDPLHWLGCLSNCRGHWSPRDPSYFSQRLHRHPATGQLFVWESAWCRCILILDHSSENSIL